MAIDDEVANAIEKAVEEVGQPEKLAKRLTHWLNDLSESDLSMEENSQHLEIVRNAVHIKSEDY